MAAQERAKQAQMKQQVPTEIPPVMQHQPMMSLPTPAQVTIDAEQEREKMMKALSGVVDDVIKTENKSLDDLKPPSIPPPQFMNDYDLKPPSMSPPPQYMAPPTATMPPPPPSFEIFEQQQKSALPPPPPPAFDTIENDLLGFPTAQAPSAPPTEESLLDNFNGMTPMAPPPPTYPTEQMNDSDEVFDFDIDGNALSPEEKRKLMEEQRAIMEQIQKQASENKASEAAVRANTFESRMMGSQTFPAPIPAPTIAPRITTTTSPEIDGVTTAIDVGSIDPTEIEEQRRILEEIQKQVRKTQGNTVGDYQSPDVSSSTRPAAPSTVDIGDGKQVALHGQEKTKEAIKDGTAILVQCVNCDNWMQVTAAATLMFCPICSVVSPVIKQDGFQTTEEIRQMEEDRKLAEMLQNEENAAVSDYPGNRRLEASRTSKSIKPPEETSWWDSLMVSMGVSANPEEDQKHSGEISVSRPPGSMTPSQRMLHGAKTGHDYEREGLLGSGGSNPRAARVAESKPLFSCVVDSVSQAASAAAAGVSSMAYGDDEEVHGVDTTSFLAVPNIGDDRGSSGNYSAIPNDE